MEQQLDDLEMYKKENKILKQRYFLMRTASEMVRQRNEAQAATIEHLQKLVSMEEMLDVEIHIRNLLEERGPASSSE